MKKSQRCEIYKQHILTLQKLELQNVIFLFHRWRFQQMVTLKDSEPPHRLQLHMSPATSKLTKWQAVTWYGDISLHTMITFSESPYLEELGFIHKALRNLRLTIGYTAYSLLQVTMTHVASFVWLHLMRSTSCLFWSALQSSAFLWLTNTMWFWQCIFCQPLAFTSQILCWGLNSSHLVFAPLTSLLCSIMGPVP